MLRFPRLFGILFLVLILCLVYSSSAGARTVDFGGLPWEQIKGRHFIVFYHPNGDKFDAQNVLRAAEDQYKTIGDTVGFTRYGDFWTWEQRAKIFIFPDQRSYAAVTGAPFWSTGYSDRDSLMFQSRAVVTYAQETSLLDEILPHEISHLILHDFIPQGNLPVWIDEGIAQLHELNKYDWADIVMRTVLKNGQHISFDVLNDLNVRREKDERKIKIFYAQSLSVIRFLLEQYGDESFRRFCRNLRDGKSVDQAVVSAYPASFRSFKDLEQRWIDDIRQ